MSLVPPHRLVVLNIQHSRERNRIEHLNDINDENPDSLTNAELSNQVWINVTLNQATTSELSKDASKITSKAPRVEKSKREVIKEQDGGVASNDIDIIDVSDKAKVDPELLFFNRVPKTGSMNLVFILEELSKMNNFTHRSCQVYGPKQLSIKQQVLVAHLKYYITVPSTIIAQQ